MNRLIKTIKDNVVWAAVFLALCLGLVIWMTRKMRAVKPVTGKITSKYGYRKHPVTGENKLHNGVDIGVPSGTSVLSPWDGTVNNVYSNAAGGKQILIDHTNGYTTGYAHLSEQLVTAGQTVAAGQVIAKSGNTGQTTGPHLHFTLRYNGELVDPETIF